jgi:hypothetical protein
MATCIQSFFKHHASKGPRKKCEQDALDAVLVACSFGDIPAASVASRLNTSRQKVHDCKVWGKGLRDDAKRFEPAERQQRSDCYRDAAKECVHAFCHSEEGSRLDTQSYRVFTVPNLETGKPEKHPLRVWNTLGLDNRHRSFLDSKIYKRFTEINPGKTICKEVFRLCVCKCVRDPTPESCVDLLFSGLYEYMQAIKQAISTREFVQKRIETCPCERHKNSREKSREELVFDDDEVIMWEELLTRRPKELIEATCCKKREEPMLCCDVGTDPPCHIPWACTSVDENGNAQCEKCGIEKVLKISSCPALTKCDTPIPLMEWRFAPRAGTNAKGDQNTQIELTAVTLPMKTVVERFVQQLGKCRPHHNQTKWISTIRGIDLDTLKENQIILLTDFSATLDLRAGEVENCSVNGHAVLDTFVVVHSPRSIIVVKDGRERIARIHECDVWHYFGDTISKGKKNDHVFHNACLVDIVAYYQRTFKQAKKPPTEEIIVWTDNCAG